MSNLKLLRTILRLKSLKITHFRFLHREKELHLAVKPYKNGCRCPDCGRRCLASSTSAAQRQLFLPVRTAARSTTHRSLGVAAGSEDVEDQTA